MNYKPLKSSFCQAQLHCWRSCTHCKPYRFTMGSVSNYHRYFLDWNQYFMGGKSVWTSVNNLQVWRHIKSWTFIRHFLHELHNYWMAIHNLIVCTPKKSETTANWYFFCTSNGNRYFLGFWNRYGLQCRGCSLIT